MFCSNCGKEIRAKRAEFCPFCGGGIEKDTSSAEKSAKEPARKTGRFNISRRTKVIMVLVAAALVAIAIIIGFHAAGLGSWKCDRCDKEWFGNAYRGKYEGSVICADCAEDYWSPKPLENYLLDANW